MVPFMKMYFRMKIFRWKITYSTVRYTLWECSKNKWQRKIWFINWIWGFYNKKEFQSKQSARQYQTKPIQLYFQVLWLYMHCNTNQLPEKSECVKVYWKLFLLWNLSMHAAKENKHTSKSSKRRTMSKKQLSD